MIGKWVHFSGADGVYYFAGRIVGLIGDRFFEAQPLYMNGETGEVIADPEGEPAHTVLLPIDHIADNPNSRLFESEELLSAWWRWTYQSPEARRSRLSIVQQTL